MPNVVPPLPYAVALTVPSVYEVDVEGRNTTDVYYSVSLNLISKRISWAPCFSAVSTAHVIPLYGDQKELAPIGRYPSSIMLITSSSEVATFLSKSSFLIPILFLSLYCSAYHTPLLPLKQNLGNYALSSYICRQTIQEDLLYC